MLGAMKPWHIIVLVVVLLLLFGAKRLPDAARGLGRSLRIFKSEVKEMQNDDDDPDRPAKPISGKTIDGSVNGTRSSETSSTSYDR